MKDFDASLKWYSDVLRFEVVNKTESDERGFKQANLKQEMY
ncbi:MAG: catechol 2,3-dioxygenase-like lactoylglutathione lyase family enzyme [Crocinitomicaceae bacterium]